MFVDFRESWPPPEPWEPERPVRRLTKGQERTIAWIVGINVVLLVIAPIGGATLIDAIVSVFSN